MSWVCFLGGVVVGLLISIAAIVYYISKPDDYNFAWKEENND